MSPVGRLIRTQLPSLWATRIPKVTPSRFSSFLVQEEDTFLRQQPANLAGPCATKVHTRFKRTILGETKSDPSSATRAAANFSDEATLSCLSSYKSHNSTSPYDYSASFAASLYPEGVNLPGTRSNLCSRRTDRVITGQSLHIHHRSFSSLPKISSPANSDVKNRTRTQSAQRLVNRGFTRAETVESQSRKFSTARKSPAELENDLMSSDTKPELDTSSAEPAQHKPLVVGLKKPSTTTTTNNNNKSNMSSAEAAQALNEEIKENVAVNTESAAPADGKQTKKKEKAPKQPKQPKPAPVTAPTSPALIDLRVGHILRAIAHPNADSLYVSTIAMGDPEGTEHTQVDEETGKVVRTVCSGLRAYIPLEEMQDRKIVVVANLKPVNMRSIKSAAMVLAASPKQEEGADPHAPDRTVELVVPPEGSEAGDKVYFEGWPYGEGKGPEKQLNPKKKQWEAVQPGFYTSEDLKVGFDAGVCDEVAGADKGLLVVEGKGPCTVPTLKGAVVR